MPVMVNEAGTHIFHIQKNRFLNICRYSYRTCDWKNHKVSINKPLTFSRVAVECFGGRELLPGEQCEHIDCDRDNNSKPNLIPRYALFQANARKVHKFAVDGKVTRVRPTKDEDGFVARVRLYTPDSYTASLTLRKRFYATQFDGNLEAAKQAAVAFRQQHTLQAGMISV
jgi:hypothetical protein